MLVMAGAVGQSPQQGEGREGRVTSSASAVKTTSITHLASIVMSGLGAGGGAERFL